MSEQQPVNDAKTIDSQQQPATTPPAAAQEPAKTFTQDELDRIIADRLKREEEKRTKATEKAAKDAEEKTLKERQEWQTLAQKREEELNSARKEVESFSESLKAMTEALQNVLESERQGLPKHITDLLDKLPMAEQLNWLSTNKAEIANAAKPPAPPDTNAGNTGKQTAQQQLDAVTLTAAKKFGIRIPTA